jgi:lipopolysaccharide assembly outer membrane protein LptD (OstA)
MPLRRAIASCLCVLAFLPVLAAPLSAADAPPVEPAPQATEPTAAPESGGAPTEGSPTSGGAAPAQESDTRSDALRVEISTAGYYELVARARELGLSDKGGAEEIRASLYKHYSLEAPAAPGKGRVVTIERAAHASYAKVEEEEGGIVRASGGVILTLVETNGDTHRIEADSIAYDRARSSLTARGKVRYERKSGTSTEVFAGEALSANLDDWSGVFIDGKMRTAGGVASPGDRGLVISADTIISRSSDIMILKDGVISSSSAEDPHYAIRAKRVWILGDKEMALSNAVFSLGNVPVLWLPFFYYPGDEIVFHPVIGYRTREGTYVQTTVYLEGRKPPPSDTTSTFSMTNNGSAQPTELRGLFLRAVPGPAPKDTGSLKTILDVYSSLGGMAGIQASYPKLSFLDKTDLFTGIGLSRSLFPEADGFYSPFDAAGNWSSVWNGTDFLNVSLPFRYAFDLTTSMRLGGFSANLALPIYSDPYFSQDFRYRSEDMDWFKLLSSSTDDPTLAPALVTQLLPKLDLSLSLKPKALDPWLQSIDITHFGASMTLLTKSDQTLYASSPYQSTLASVDPKQQFFYPSVFRPIDTTATFHGSLFGSQAPSAPAANNTTPATGSTAPAAGATPAASSATPVAGEKPNTGTAPVELRDPWEEGSDEEKPSSGSTAGGAASATVSGATATAFRLPSSVPSTAEAKAPSWTESATWTISPSLYYEDRYRSDWLDASGNSYQWTSPAQINFNSLLYGLLSFRIASSIDASAAYGDSIATSLSLSFLDQEQKRPIDTADPVTAASYAQADDLYMTRSVDETAKVAYKPFTASWLWSATSLGWEFDSTLYGMKYDSTLATPAFTESWLSWDPSSITAHNLSLNLAARPEGLTQSLSFIANLPPTLDSYSAQLSLNAGLATLKAQSRMYRSAPGAEYSFDPVSTTLTIGNSPGPALSENLVYGGSIIGPVSNAAGLSWGPFSVSIQGQQTPTYTLNLGSGWVANNDEAFDWYSNFSLGLKPVFKSQDGADVQWSIAPDLELSQSLVQFTQSTLSFGLTASLKIGHELTVSISSLSQNTSAWQYYTGLFASTPIVDSSGAQVASPTAFQVSPLADIWDSLSIWNADDLRKSLFKLKSLSVAVVRDLEDWTLSAQVSTSPLYNPTGNTYNLDTKISIILAWKDISAVKSTINYDSNPISPLTSITY